MWDFLNCHFVIFFETCLERSPYFTYLYNNSAVLILMLMLSSKIKLSYTILIHTWKTLVAFFTLFIFWLFDTSLNKWVYFWKTQNIWKHIFTWYCRTFINSLLFIKGEFLYKENKIIYQNYIARRCIFPSLNSKEVQKDEKLVF